MRKTILINCSLCYVHRKHTLYIIETMCDQMAFSMLRATRPVRIVAHTYNQSQHFEKQWQEDHWQIGRLALEHEFQASQGQRGLTLSKNKNKSLYLCLHVH